MCGFAGFLSFDGSVQDAHQRRGLLVAMGNAIAHRGPDDAQYFDDGTLALVFRRLSIIDVEGGRQPIRNETGKLLIVANGEIYNHRALRDALEPSHSFSSRSDCEVPLHAYEEWGEQAFERLEGMFAIALWNRESKSLLLARDRLGIKPLYVCHVKGGVLFGSELKALLAHPACPRRLDWYAVKRDMICQPPTTTYLEGVEMLPGGHLMTVTARGAIRNLPWWRLETHLGTAPLGMDQGAYTNRYADLLEEVTHRHLQRDVGAGIHLSGGVDSSLIAAIVARKERDFPCFTIAERTTCLAGDVESARTVTGLLGLPWYPVRFDYRTVLDEMNFDFARLEQAVWMMECPRFDLEWLFKEELHRFAKARVPGLKVVLLGQGADEFAGGYSARLDKPYGSWQQYLDEEVAPNLLFDDANERGLSDDLRGLLAPREAQPGRYFRMMLLHVRQLQNHNLWHEDRSSSWHSLEARVPFLDHHLVELLASIPQELQETLFWNKRIVRSAARRFLPEHEFRQPKMGCMDSTDGASLELILHGIAQRCVGAFRQKYVDSPGFLFDRAKIDRLMRQVMGGSPGLDRIKRLLECMTISIFERQCRDNTAAASAAAARDGQRTLNIVRANDWDDFLAEMSGQARSVVEWDLGDRVRLPENAEVVVPLRGSETQRYSIVVDGVVVSRIDAPPDVFWLTTFLKNLGTATTADFTLQNWIEEFELGEREFLDAMTFLYRAGVIVREDASLAKLPTLVAERAAS